MSNTLSIVKDFLEKRQITKDAVFASDYNGTLDRTDSRHCNWLNQFFNDLFDFNKDQATLQWVFRIYTSSPQDAMTSNQSSFIQTLRDQTNLSDHVLLKNQKVVEIADKSKLYVDDQKNILELISNLSEKMRADKSFLFHPDDKNLVEFLEAWCALNTQQKNEALHNAIQHNQLTC